MCVLYVQLVCCCLTLAALSLKGQGKKLVGIGALETRETSRVELQTDLFILLYFAPDSDQRRACTGAY